MPEESKREAADTAMRRINRAWLDGKVDELAALVHPEMVMVFPGFSGRGGREEILAGFRDFCENAKTLEFREHDRQIDIAGDTAVISFQYEMIYERSGAQYRATGRDLWVFQRQETSWIAVWRTMLDPQESPA